MRGPPPGLKGGGWLWLGGGWLKRGPPGGLLGGKPPFMGICMCMFILFMLFMLFMPGPWPSKPGLTEEKKEKKKMENCVKM